MWYLIIISSYPFLYSAPMILPTLASVVSRSIFFVFVVFARFGVTSSPAGVSFTSSSSPFRIPLDCTHVCGRLTTCVLPASCMTLRFIMRENSK